MTYIVSSGALNSTHSLSSSVSETGNGPMEERTWKKMSFKTRMKCTIRQVTDWSMMWIREGWDRTCRWNTKRWRKLIPQVRSCMPEWAFRDLEIWLNWWVKESYQWRRPCGSGWLNGNKITEVVWSRRLKEFICDRDAFVFYAIWYLEPVKWFQNLVSESAWCKQGVRWNA